MNLPIPLVRILNVSLEPESIRFLLVRLAGGKLIVEKTERVACSNIAGWASATTEQYQRIAALIAEIRTAMGAENAKIRVALPAEAVFYRQWNLPPSSRAKEHKAVRLLLETELPFSSEDITVRLCWADGNGKGRSILAVCMLTQHMLDWNAAMELQGIEQELVTVHPFGLLPLLSYCAQEKQGCISHFDTKALLEKYRKKFGKPGKLPESSPGQCEKVAALCLGGKIVFSLVRKGRICAVWECEQNSGLELIADKHKLEAALRLVEGGNDAFCKALTLFCEKGTVLAQLVSADLPAQTELFSSPNLLLDLSSPLTASDDEKELLQDPGGWAPALGLASLGLVSLCGKRFLSPFSSAALSGKIPVFHSPNSAVSRTFYNLFTRRMRYCALWGLALVLAWGFATWAQTGALREELEVLNQSMRGAFQKAVPGAASNLAPAQVLAILRERIAGRESSNVPGACDSGVLELLRLVHEAAPDGLDIILNTIRIDGQHLTLSGTAADFSEIERFREALSGIAQIAEVRILSATAGKGNQERVAFEINCSRELNP